MRGIPYLGSLATILLCIDAGAQFLEGQNVPSHWRMEWPNTDFSTSLVEFGEVLSGGPPKDGIPAIDNPQFVSVEASAELGLQDDEPVIALVTETAARAYPLRYLMWHEVVNDRIDGRSVAVTFCPLCNAGIAFKAEHGDQELSFGVTGKLRNSDLIMYDRQTESWWQQYSGEAIVGQFAAEQASLMQIPIALESWKAFRSRHRPEMLVMAAPVAFSRPYGTNPYAGYDSLQQPWLYKGDLSGLRELGVGALERVVVVRRDDWPDARAWPLDRVRAEARIHEEGVVIRWTEQYHNSALDTPLIPEGKSIPSIQVRDVQDLPVIHEVVFAFVFCAFSPEGIWHLADGPRQAPGCVAE